MGKTLKRQRAREAAAAAGLAQRAPKQQKRDPSDPPKPARASSVHQQHQHNLAALVSVALEARDWDAALDRLEALRASGRPPKLGAVQRWVRDADAAGDEALAAKLICAVLRAAAAGTSQKALVQQQQNGAVLRAAVAGASHKALVQQQQNGTQRKPEGQCGGPGSGTTSSALVTHTPVRRYPPWSPRSPTPAASKTAAADAPETAGETSRKTPENPKFYEVPRAPGAGGADSMASGSRVRIYAYPPGSAVTYDPAHPPVTRADVPFVLGAFVLCGALSKSECAQMLSAGKALGFTRDVDYAFGGGGSSAAADGGAGAGAGRSRGISAFDSAAAAAAMAVAAADGGTSTSASAARRVAAETAGMAPFAGRPAEGCVWFADESVLGPLWRRVAHLLPQTLGGGNLAGINPRWRLYRYSPGAVYRPHVDGAWPGSGLDSEGRYLFDAHDGDQYSRLTFLIYLNSAEGADAAGAEASAAPGAEEAAAASGAADEADAAAKEAAAAAAGVAEGAAATAADGVAEGTPSAAVAEGAGPQLQQSVDGGREEQVQQGAREAEDLRKEQKEHQQGPQEQQQQQQRKGQQQQDEEGFEGGATTFFAPAPGAAGRAGCLEARGVLPRAGNILVFPHGDTAGALVHEGSPVVRGAKYVVRTEVLYTRPPKDASGRRRAAGI